MEINDIDKLFTATGKLNSAIIRREWFKSSGLYTELTRKTAFLPDECLVLERIHCYINNIQARIECLICQAPAHFIRFSGKYGSYSQTCNKRSCIAKFTLEKRHKTCIAKYGGLVSKNHISNDKNAVNNFIKKSKETIRQRYGVENVSVLSSVISKKKQTLKTNYGVNSPCQIKHCAEQRYDRMVNRFAMLSNAVCILSIDDPAVTCKMVSFRCKSCNREDVIPSETFKWRCRKMSSPCSSCAKQTLRSIPQQQLTDYIKSIYSGQVLSNVRTILPNRKELDIFIPELKIAIEFNGLFWHSSATVGEDIFQKNRHTEKLEQCNSLGIRLINIFEDDWENKKHSVCTRIHSLIYTETVKARDITFIKTDLSEIKRLQPLYIDNVPDQADTAVFMVSNEDIKAALVVKEHELFFFPIKEVVLDGKIDIKSALNLYHATTCLVDNCWGYDEILSSCGFIKKENIEPRQRWVRGMKTLTAHVDDESVLLKNKWRKLWDCGTTKWILE